MNTRSCERVNGLAVVLRGYASMVGEISGDQWNEGDVACSVVRRVAIADAFYAFDGLIETFGAGFSAGGDVELFVAKTRELLAESGNSQRMGDGAQKMVSEWLDNAKNTEAFLEGLK
jgi:hypothetical protein